MGFLAIGRPASIVAIQRTANAPVHLGARQGQRISVRLGLVGMSDSFEDAVRFMSNTIRNDFDFTAAPTVRFDSHDDHRLNPRYTILIVGPLDLGLDGIIQHQLKVQMLQPTCLVRKEGEEIAPVCLRARVDIRMMRNAKVPTEVSYTSQPLRWHYYLEEFESNTVLPEFEGISAVEGLDRL